MEEHMKTEQQDRTIFPLDLTSLTSLLASDGGHFAPLRYEIQPSSTSETKIHVDIQQCDPDSIDIDISTHALVVRANASFQFSQSNSISDQILLNRDVETSIPLAPGIRANDIHSTLSDQNLIITIPH